MAAFTKINSFVEAMAEGKHDFATDQVVVALTAAASPPDASDAILTDITQIAYTYLSTRNVTTTSSAQTGGTYKLTLTDLTLTCSGGTAATFRYIVLYNDGAASDELIGFYDYGSNVTLNDGDTFQIDFDDANGCFQLA
jgi:hypothetical protein